MTDTYSLTGYVSCLANPIGFLMPIFAAHDHDIFVQMPGEKELISGFAQVDLHEITAILPSSIPLCRGIGDPIIYAFALPKGELLVGDRQQLEPELNNHLSDLSEYPFVVIDIHAFLHTGIPEKAIDAAYNILLDSMGIDAAQGWLRNIKTSYQLSVLQEEITAVPETEITKAPVSHSHTERFDAIRNIAIKYASLCDELHTSIFDVVSVVHGVNTIWRQIPSSEWHLHQVDMTSGFSMLMQDKNTASQTLCIFTCSPTITQSIPIFIAIHELSHWILKHAKSNQFQYGSLETYQEEEASYLAFALLLMNTNILAQYYTKSIDVADVVDWVTIIYPHMFLTKIDGLREAKDIINYSRRHNARGSSSAPKTVCCYTDKTLTCRDCGRSFVFTAGEQEFHEQKGFTNTPGRCPACRAQRKAEGGFGGGGRRNGGPREMHIATCASCGNACQVPFQPSGEKPIYCSNCMNMRKSGNNIA